MVQQVELFDGSRIEFEDGTSQEVMDSVAAKHTQGLQRKQAAQTPEQDELRENASYGGAIAASLKEGVRQGVGGAMEAAGDELLKESAPSFSGKVMEAMASPTRALDMPKTIFEQTFLKSRELVEGEDAAASRRETGQNLQGAGAELGDQARENLQAATPQDLSLMGEAGISIANSVGQMVPWLVGGRLGAVRPGFATAGALSQFGSQSFGQAYNEAKAAGAEPDVAYKAALANGWSEVLGEKLGLDTLLKGGSNWLKKFVAQEIGGEEFTTIAQSLTEKGLYNPEKWSSPDEVMHDLTLTALSAAGGAGVVGGVGKALDYTQRRRTEQVFENVDAHKELARIVGEAEAGISAPAVVPLREPTPQELEEAAVVKKQRRQGLQVELTPEQVVFGEKLDRAFSPEVFKDEGGISAAVAAARSERFVEETLPFSKRPIAFAGSNNQHVLGLTLEQIGEKGLSEGAVLAVRGDAGEEIFPDAVYSKLTEDLDTWRKKYIPDARIVMNLTQFAGEKQKSSFGAFESISLPSGQLYVITPREMPSFSHSGGDYKTQLAVLGGIVHEFGHAIKHHTFFEGLAGKLDDGARMRLESGTITGNLSLAEIETLRTVAPEEANLLHSWISLRTSALQGHMTAHEFIERWVGIRKLGDSIAKTTERERSVYSWAKGVMGRPLEGVTAKELIGKAFGNAETALSFDEFMAEQFSRYSYSVGDMQKSGYAKVLQNVMGKLRALFLELKGLRGQSGEKLIQPGETFSQWMDSMTLRNANKKVPTGRIRLNKRVKEAQKALLPKKLAETLAKVKKEEAVPAPIPEQAQPEESIVATAIPTKELLEKQLDMLANRGAFYHFPAGQEAARRMIKGMIERGQLERAIAKMEEISGETIQWDREYSSKVLSRLPDKAKVKAETLRGLMRQADIKQQEKVFWAKFMQENPEGTFLSEELKQAVQDATLPLERVPAADQNLADYGILRVFPEEMWGEPYAATVNIYKGPVELGGAERHFEDDPGYAAHSRTINFSGVPGRYVLELQSDLFQQASELYMGGLLGEAQLEQLTAKIGEVGQLTETVGKLSDLRANAIAQNSPAGVLRAETALKAARQARDAAKREVTLYVDSEAYKAPIGSTLHQYHIASQNWMFRLAQEELADAFESGQDAVYFPVGDTNRRIQRWPYAVEIEWDGAPATALVVEDSMSVTVRGQFGQRTFHLKDAPQMQEVYDTALAQKTLYSKVAPIVRNYAELEKRLVKEFGGARLEMPDGTTWLRVPTSAYGKKVLLWDEENPLNSSLAAPIDFAGVAEVDYRNPEVIAQAAGMWERLGFQSPFFLRWGGDTKVRGADGNPLRVWRGSGDRVTYLDPTTRGGQTGSASARKAFWFTDNQRQAGFYADQAAIRARRKPKDEFAREATKLREELADLRELAVMDLKQEEREVVSKGILSRMKRLHTLHTAEAMSRWAAPAVQGFYLNLENPLEVDALGAGYDDKVWNGWVEQAIAGGHDGLIVRNGHDPYPGTTYAIFQPEQAKLENNIGTFDPTDNLHWDEESPGQLAAREGAKVVQGIWAKTKLRAANMAAKGVDALTQLQQTAAAQPDDVPLQLFMKLSRYGMKMKNNLQVDAEDLVGDMQKSGPGLIEDLHRVMTAEWRGGTLASTLVGKDENGEVVWGGDKPTTPEARALVASWEVVDGLRLRKFFSQHGVDVMSERGKKILAFYLRARNIMLKQFQGLENTLRYKALHLYEGAPGVLSTEYWEIEQLMQKLRDTPFLPRGAFGNHVILLQEKSPETGRFVTAERYHYEDAADFQAAYTKMQAAARNNPNLRVKSQELDDYSGLVMQFPRDFLEKLAEAGDFTDEQLESVADLLTTSRYSRIAERFDKIAAQSLKANGDFVRVFADFALRNSNYIWKMHFSTAMRGAISQERSAIRRLEKAEDLTPEAQLAQLTRLRRNVRLMEKALEYMLYPPQEFQTARMWITMFYLAYNLKTALMNFSTQMNTAMAVTTEFGEVKGAKYYSQALYDTASYMWLNSRIEQAKGDPVESQRLNEVMSVITQATADGVLDQSYAYFLAGQANASGLMRSVHNTWLGKATHVFTEMGMAPFKLIESANRMSALLTFYSAERGAGTSPGEAYERAIAKVNLLQNSYDAPNRPAFMRGKKSILFMFASYAQFMGWIMTGGYERAARADMRARGRDPGSWMAGTTMKLWLMYLALGGIGGLPFAENAMDFVQFVWRRMFGNPENIEIELRRFITELGMDSNVVMSGMMHDAGGFNLSGSFGLGRLIPGTDLLNKQWESPGQALGDAGIKFAGPAGGFYQGVAKAVAEFGKGNLGEGLKNVPGMVGSISKGMDAWLDQEDRPTYGVTTKAGERLVFDRKTGEYRDLSAKEIAGMLMGAQPTVLSETKEARYLVSSEQMYWQTRRRDLVDKYFRAVSTGDDQLRTDVRTAIDGFNDQAPYPGLRITGKQLAESVKARRRAAHAMEVFGSGQKTYRGIAEDVREVTR